MQMAIISREVQNIFQGPYMNIRDEECAGLIINCLVRNAIDYLSTMNLTDANKKKPVELFKKFNTMFTPNSNHVPTRQQF